MQFPIFIARRFLARQKGTFSAFIIRLAIVATALGVAVMVVSTSLISGFKFSIREKLYSFWGHAMVAPFDSQGSDFSAAKPLTFDPALQNQLARTAHVQHVFPFAMRPVIVQANGQMEGLRGLKGVNENFVLSPGIALSGRGINYADTGYSKDILLSQTTASRLELKTGDKVLLYALEPGSTAPRVRRLTVSGIYHTGMEEVDKNFAICDIRLIQRLSNWAGDQISGYQIEIDNPALADTVANDIYDRYINPPLAARSINNMYEGLFDWLNMQDTNATILIIIVSIMAIINLGAALLILIVDRAVMIGVLKSLGMPDTSLQRIFIYLAGLIGIFGLVIGNVLGIGLCLLQKYTGFLHLPEATYYMRTVPVHIVWWQIAVIDIGTLLLCFVCMTLPALYIRRVNPSKVLQFK